MNLRIFQIALFALVLAACGGNKTAQKTAEDGSVEPDQLKPQLDTRFQEKFFAAQLLKAKGEYEKAYSLFGECATIEPNEPSVHFEMARIDQAIHIDPNAALTHVSKSIEINPENSWYRRLRGEIYMDLGKYELAAKDFGKSYELNPADQEVLYDQASAYLVVNKFSEAIAVYDELEKNVGVYEELSFRKHELYMQQDKLELAGNELEKLAAANPTEARYWGIVAQFYQRIEQKEKAKAALDKMIKADPDNGLVHYQLSEYYAAENEDEKSFEELKAAFRTTDLNIDEKIMVMMKFYQLTETEIAYMPKAYELLDILAEVNKTEAKAFSIRGDFLFRDGRDNEAVEAFLKATQLDASKSLVWEQTLNLLLILNRTDELILNASKAVELFPNNPLFYLYLGAGHEKNKNYEEAIFNWSLGKELVVENPALLGQFYSSLGSAYNASKNYSKSDESFEKALKLLPYDMFVRNNYAYYLSVRNVKLDQAEKLSQQTVNADPNNPSFQDTYGWILFQQGKYNEALIWIKKSVEAEANPSGEVLEHYGDVLFKLGRIEEAWSQWKAAKAKGGASPKIDDKINSKTIE